MTNPKEEPQTNSPASTRSARSHKRLIVGFALLAVAIAVYLYSLPKASEQAGQMDSAITDPQLVRARQRISQGQAAAVLPELQARLEDDPDSQDVRRVLIEAYLAEQKYSQAEKHVDVILETTQDDPVFLWWKGLLLRHRGQDGQEYFQRAVEHPRAGARIHAEYGLMQLHDDVKKARPHLQKAYEGGVHSPAVLMALGEISLKDDDFPAAEQYFSEAAEADSRAAGPWILLAGVQQAKGKTSASLETLKEAAELVRGSGRGEVYRRLGAALEAEESWLEAAEAYEAAGDYPAVALAGWMNAARCYYQAGQYARAMTCIDRAKLLAPQADIVTEWQERIENARFGEPKPVPGDLGAEE